MGSGRTGTVWLAVHLGLEEYRAIKCVCRKNADYEVFRREALILKELQHPGIPMIYDLEEDSEYFYLIEEYLKGYSLYTLIKRQGTLEEADAVRYGMQICGLVEYMHSACKLPILYLDLQPNNLIICDGTVKLIDFDHALFSTDANSGRQRYGTVGCAAPEQYSSDHMLDQRTDIYAIGAVLRFMLYGTLKQGEAGARAISAPLDRIIRKCMETDMDRRYVSAKEAGDALRGLSVRKLEVQCDNKARPSLVINLAGTRPGAGTTHFGFGLLFYLTRRGYEVLYEEHNHSQAVRTMALHGKVRPDKMGIYHLRGCYLKPWYGPAVRLMEPSGYQIVLKDYGTDWGQMEKESAGEEGALVILATSSPWDMCYWDRAVRHYMNQKEGREAVIVFRHIPPRQQVSAGLIPGRERIFRKALMFGSPEYKDPFRQQTETEAFFRSVWDGISKSAGQADIKRGWLKGWRAARNTFLNAARTLRENAGSSGLPGQEGGQE